VKPFGNNRWISMTIGVLALQGDFARHIRMIEGLAAKAVEVKTKATLHSSDGLIIPGGESTTLAKLLHKHHLWDQVVQFGRTKPIYGTCAGLILLGTSPILPNLDAMGLIDIAVQRNAYGRQIDSFVANLELHLPDQKVAFEGVFIRAPKITGFGKSVQPLAWHDGNVVLAESDRILVSTFHPELTDDPAIHSYFIRQVAASMQHRDIQGAA